MGMYFVITGNTVMTANDLIILMSYKVTLKILGDFDECSRQAECFYKAIP